MPPVRGLGAPPLGLIKTCTEGHTHEHTVFFSVYIFAPFTPRGKSEQLVSTDDGVVSLWTHWAGLQMERESEKKRETVEIMMNLHEMTVLHGTGEKLFV